VTRWLSLAANYTYDSTRTLSAPDTSDPFNRDPNYLTGEPLLRRPVNSGNAMLNASFLRMNWNLSGYFTGPRADYGYPDQVRNPGYARFDLAASYNFTHGLSVYGRITNLADKQYQEAYGYPALGREFRIGVKYTTRRE
jgi:vitamin B12 transporter